MQKLPEPRPTILLVDDDEPVIRSLQRLLRREPYDLIWATSGAQAIEMLQMHPVNLILTDNRMPEMSGTKLLKLVKQRWPRITRVILSGYSQVDAIDEAKREGAVHMYLTKPWEDEELKANIRAALAAAEPSSFLESTT